MWDPIPERLALLELLTTSTLRRRTPQHTAHAWLAELPWTRATGRQHELALVPEHRPELVALLDRVWPDWRAEHLALLELGQPPTPAGWRRLADHRRAEALPLLPDRLNRRTAAAVTAPGAKSTLTPSRRDRLGDREVVDDGLIRLRPPPGLHARRGDRVLPLDDVVALLDEVAVTDRALRDGLVLAGPLDAILLVENLGPWRDLPRPAGWLFAHVPGWNTSTLRQLLTRLPVVPLVHFGDLDPNGVRILRHLRAALPHLAWLVPPFWREYLDTHAHRRPWPKDLSLADTPPLVRDLAATGRWLEQEPLVFDPRLPAALESARSRSRTPG